MIITIITLDGKKFELSFDGVITIQMIKQKLFDEYNFNSSKYSFIQCEKVLDNSSETLNTYNNVIVAINNQIFPEKSFPKYNNSFQINFSRYSDTFIQYETNISSYNITQSSEEYDSFLDENQIFSDRNLHSSQINQNDNNHEIVNDDVGLSFFHPFYNGLLHEYRFNNNHMAPNDQLPINSQHGGRSFFGLGTQQINVQTNQNYFFQQNSREHNFQNR